MSKIEIKTAAGDFFAAAHWLNQTGRADQLVQMVEVDRSRTLLILRVPAAAKSEERTCVAESGDGPADEIELTPEMIEAGALVVASFFDEVVAYGSGTARLAAIEAYSAMERARVESVEPAFIAKAIVAGDDFHPHVMLQCAGKQPAESLTMPATAPPWRLVGDKIKAGTVTIATMPVKNRAANAALICAAHDLLAFANAYAATMTIRPGTVFAEGSIITSPETKMSKMCLAAIDRAHP